MRKITFRKVQELKRELIVGKSNFRTNHVWYGELPKLENAFVNGRNWESEKAEKYIDSREKAVASRLR